MAKVEVKHRPPIKALILDVDGTLLRGREAIPGIAALDHCLRQRRIARVVASNNSTRSPADYQSRLARHGFELSSPDILTAGVATVSYLQQHLPPGAKVYVVGEAALVQAIASARFEVQAHAGAAVSAVVVGGDSQLTYEKLKHATLLLQRGALFIGTNPDLVYPTEEGLVPEAGTTLAALEAATGIKPTVLGKPERYLFDLALRRLGHDAPATAIVGDRLETDIAGGQRAGLATILTLTGVDDQAAAAAKQIQPDWIVRDPLALVDLLEQINAGDC